MLLDLDGPETLDTFWLCVIVACMCGGGIDLGDTECEKRQRKQFESVLGGGAVFDFREEGVLGAGFLVGGGLEGADGSLDYVSESAMCRMVQCQPFSPLNISFLFSSWTTVRGFSS